MRVTEFDKDAELSWLTGRLQFSNTPLKALMAEAERAYDVKIVFDIKDLEPETITGVMDRNQPLETFLTNVKNTGRLNYRVDADSIIHLY
ncbi:MAG TPA: DUF4974 domain-containing protein [Chitinophagaceae bacterium]|nr:DUF4974 domain-containing protein [Chitinophagaceae bacterium]